MLRAVGGYLSFMNSVIQLEPLYQFGGRKADVAADGTEKAAAMTKPPRHSRAGHTAGRFDGLLRRRVGDCMAPRSGGRSEPP